MPIGVPRIVYCWGEELPAQWTDIYNFIFRRRMVFLMQYLDDELCNQICGLLINIHMEDRAKELQKKEMENSGLFKNSLKQQKKLENINNLEKQNDSKQSTSFLNSSKKKTIEDLLTYEDDLAIYDNYTLEQYTLQKITLEWLNWNSQVFDYSDEPYLFYIAELLSKEFYKDEKYLLYKNSISKQQISLNSQNNPISNDWDAMEEITNTENSEIYFELSKILTTFKNFKNFFGDIESKIEHLDIYSPFRLLSNFALPNYNSVQVKYSEKNLFNKINNLQQTKNIEKVNINGNKLLVEGNLESFSKDILTTSNVSSITKAEFINKLKNTKKQINFSKKVLTQKNLRQSYKNEDFLLFNNKKKKSTKPFSYFNSILAEDSDSFLKKVPVVKEFRENYRKQKDPEEESKKVFVIINSFGGSVGNGITIHDALQFIKAGSLTLALGVAASAASLALAGGTIGERYVTEGCHVMIHQPEGGLTGQASDIWIDSQEIMKIRLDVAEIYSLSTYRPRHKILKDLDRDFYLTAMETIFYGLADEIATNDVIREIIEMTSKIWDSHDSKQQRLLENRASVTSGLDTEAERF